MSESDLVVGPTVSTVFIPFKRSIAFPSVSTQTANQTLRTHLIPCVSASAPAPQ